MADIREIITGWLIGSGIHEDIAAYLLNALFIAVIILVIYLSDVLSKGILLKGLGVLVKKTKTHWDNVLYEKQVFNRLAHVVPAFIIYTVTPLAFPDSPILSIILRNGSLVYMVLITLLVAYSFLDTFYDLYRISEISSQVPLKGFVQALKIVLAIIAVILIMSAITNRTPIYFLSGIGALTAVLLLIFKDAILGLVAGIQLTANNMVRAGDWIEMPQFGADGDVIDVALTTVKVQNWDKTITTVPAYALISQSFKNWRGMEESGGRRIKRALNIDMTTIKFCDEEMISRFSKIQYIREYLDRKKEEIAEWNRAKGVDDSSLVNGRHLTNIGTFRAYVEAYLRHHPKVHQDMTFLVRQLQPTDKGLPLEIYVFSNDQRWAHYEAIQADIFDHLFAALSEFDLRVFQNPVGSDFRKLCL